MVYQHDSLFPWLTVAENIDVGIGRGTDDNERAAQISSMLTLARLEEFAHHYPHQLSGGMRRRAELARVLAGPADVLLLDEPFASLDYQTRRRMHGELVRMLSEEPRAVVLVTHDVEEAALLADRIIVFSESPGRVCAEFRVDLPRERNTTEPAVLRAVEGIVSKLAL
jgi:ABC-type nitrate/sulfonate/bicarbonate transport system ATPase subunit